MSQLSRRAMLKWSCLPPLLTGVGGLPGLALAQVPQDGKVIRIIVPFAPGGSNDIVARALAHRLELQTKRHFLVDNKAGAGGVVGSELASRAEPDGTTLLLISSTFTMNPAVMTLRYDPIKSFHPVAMLGMGPSVIAVPANSPWKTIQDLIDSSRKRPDEVMFGSAGVASFQHFAIAQFMQKTGARLNLVHYKGGGPALMDLAAGRVHVCLGSLIQMQALLKAGKIRLLAVTGAKRIDLIPQVPTLREAGFDLEVQNWWGLLAPAGTPKDWISQLHGDINTALSSPELRQRLVSEGAETTPMSIDDFANIMATDMQNWAQVARATEIQVK